MRKPAIITLLVLLILLLAVGVDYEIGRWQMPIVHAATAAAPAPVPADAKWAKVSLPLHITHGQSQGIGVALVEGFWKSTSTAKDKQLVFPVAVKINCTLNNKTCNELEASLVFGVLKPDLITYEITSWTDKGIVADDTDEGSCGIGKRLSLDFASNSVTVTDYPKKIVTNNPVCKGFQDANSYVLQGGSLALDPPPTWEP